MTRSLFLVASLWALSAVAAPDETPERRVELLLTLPHGLHKLSPEQRARLAELKENPAAHLAALAKLFPPGWVPDEQSPLSWEEMRLLAATLLAGELKTPEADAFLAGWYLRLAPEGAAPGALAKVRVAALYALGDRKNEPVVEYLISHFEKVDDAHRAQMLTWLEQAYRGDARVIAQLRAILQAKTVRYDDNLARAIKWIETN